MRITFRRNPFIFRGAGCLVPMIVVVSVLIANEVVNSKRFFGFSDLIYGIALIISGLLLVSIGQALNKEFYAEQKRKNAEVAPPEDEIKFKQ